MDFGPGSLEVLDGLVRQAATSSQEITEQRMTPFVQGAIWYTGEVFRRHRDMVWKYVPDNLDGELHPFFGSDVATAPLDHPCVGDPADPENHLYMLNMIRGMFLTEDDFGDPVVNTLPSLYANPFGEGDVDGDEDDEDDE
ncbi:hypothetical protein ACFW9D_04465 [Streptomyces sp. NPDC059524]|uniref:hypothetical protein n=1 Tax=Streptomyces sp. NPDC059524 TaxID=3346856 RepID=UPI0036C547D3